jgi:hypothetical protein
MDRRGRAWTGGWTGDEGGEDNGGSAGSQNKTAVMAHCDASRQPTGIQGAGRGSGNGMDESARVSAQAQGQPAGRAAEQQSRGRVHQGTRAHGHKGKGHTQTGLFPVAPSARGSQPPSTAAALSQKDGPALRPPPPRLPFTSPAPSRTPHLIRRLAARSRYISPSGSFWLHLAPPGISWRPASLR